MKKPIIAVLALFGALGLAACDDVEQGEMPPAEQGGGMEQQQGGGMDGGGGM